MLSKLHNKEKGFTIIEVVLVLAIAGLIFLIVFLALPALQRSRRDTQRRSDAGRILASLETYAGNSSGNYPVNAGEVTSFWTTYVNNPEFRDPTTGNIYADPGYTVGAQTATLAAGVWQYITGAQCGNNGVTTVLTGQRNIAVRMGLEQGVHCTDNR